MMPSTRTSTAPSHRHGNCNGGHYYHHDITVHNLATTTKLEASAVVHNYDDDDTIFQGLDWDDVHNLRPDAASVDLSEDTSSQDSRSLLLDDPDTLDMVWNNDDDNDETTLETSFHRVIELLIAAFYIALVVHAFLWGCRLALGDWLLGASFNKLKKHRRVLKSTSR